MESFKTNLKPNIQSLHHVLIIEEPTLKKTIILKEATYSIGRQSDNDIIISLPKISRHHATFLRRTDVKTNNYSYWLLDGDLQGNRSRNGIYVNGKRCLVHELKHGDTIRLGDEVIVNYQIISDLGLVVEAGEGFLKETVKSQSEPISKKTIFNKETVINPERQTNFLDNYELIRLASFSELNSQPIFEIDLQGNITYLNSATISKFPDLKQKNIAHPFLSDLIKQCNQNNNKITREVRVNKHIFEQNAHYLPENKIIRSYIVDLTKQKKLEEKLQWQEEFYRTLLHQVPVGIVLVDGTTKKIVDVNAISCELLNYTREEICKLTIDRLSWKQENLETNLQYILENKISLTDEIVLRKKDGSTVKVEMKISLVGTGTEPQFLIIVRELRKDSISFPPEQIISLNDRVFFRQQLKKAIAHGKRHQKLIGVIYIKLEYFSEINNNIGNELTNRLLYSFAERLKSCLRAGDTVAYWSEDKFAVLMPEIDTIEEVAKIARRIAHASEESFKLDEHQFILKSHIGIAIYPQDGEQVDTLLNNADFALYRPRLEECPPYQFYNPTMNAQASVLLRLEHSLYRALEKDELLLHYQPQINVNSGHIQGIEAFLRWQHPELGIVSPTSFIKLAEQTGLIIPIGEWVLKTACTQTKIWQSQGLPPLRVSVNLSSLQFQQPNLPLMVEKILSEVGLEPHLLELEINASTLAKNREYSYRTLKQLQELGVYICVDDFATGFSSFDCLKKFSFHTLKIDRSFVQNLKNDPQDLAIILALVTLGKGLNLRVVAEGVETKQQIELLRSLQCEQMQGFWFSRPLAAEDATRLLPLDWKD
ncbi:EAL domain-containing protein [Pleurocapsales cyanobacterium LEGE 06147]|nr:EAL domain-containing protein [Pleurocapsales cyanobacterium LEGE 06147]